jgi:hypothetical protein
MLVELVQTSTTNHQIPDETVITELIGRVLINGIFVVQFS